MVILNGNDETITYDKKKDKLWVKEVFYQEKLIGINVMVNLDLIDTYSNDDSAQQIIKYLFNTDEKQIDIEKLNFKIEAF